MPTMRPICPNCKSDNIQLRSRTIFLKRIIICLCIFGFGYFIFDDMRDETDVDGVVLVGLFGGTVTMATSLVVGVIWFSWFIATKKTTYRCGYCKDVFENPEHVRSLTNEELRNTIIKRKID